MTNTSITFETKCYENDWQYILSGIYLDKMIKRCGVNFDKKQLIINNVKDRPLITSYAEEKKRQGIIDAYYFTEDYEQKVLQFFNIKKDSFGKGFIYSISELTGIYKCTTDYLLHFSSDAFLSANAKKTHWIERAILVMNKTENADCIVATPVWNNLYVEAKSESIKILDEFYLAQGFSDQCYLVKTKIFNKSIYNEYNAFSERYPKYGGELFEKRVDAFMRNNDKYRLIHRKASYRHANFPKTGIKRYMSLKLASSSLFTFSLFGRHPNNLNILFTKLKSNLKAHLCHKVEKKQNLLTPQMPIERR